MQIFLEREKTVLSQKIEYLSSTNHSTTGITSVYCRRDDSDPEQTERNLSPAHYEEYPEHPAFFFFFFCSFLEVAEKLLHHGFGVPGC